MYYSKEFTDMMSVMTQTDYSLFTGWNKANAGNQNGSAFNLPFMTVYDRVIIDNDTSGNMFYVLLNNSYYIYKNGAWISLDGVVSIITPSETFTDAETELDGYMGTLSPYPITYKWGELGLLLITVSATSQYRFMFTCPQSDVTYLEIDGVTRTIGDELEAGSTYIVDIWGGIAKIRNISQAL